MKAFDARASFRALFGRNWISFQLAMGIRSMILEHRLGNRS